MDLQSDAKAVSLKGLEAALKSFDEMVYAKAVMQGQEKLSWNNSSVDMGSDVPVSTWYGHTDPYDAFFELLDKPVNECSMYCVYNADWIGIRYDDEGDYRVAHYYIRDAGIDPAPENVRTAYSNLCQNCRITHKVNKNKSEVIISSEISGC